MKRDFLKKLLDKVEDADNIIDAIMKEYGAAVEKLNSKYADYDDIKKQLDDASKTIEKFADYDTTKAEVEKWKKEYESAKQESALKIAKMERENNVRNFTSSKKFVNEFTRDSINNLIAAELEKETAKGKSIEDIFAAVTKDKENLFVEENKPTPPTVAKMGDGGQGGSSLSAINKARQIMGLPPKTE